MVKEKDIGEVSDLVEDVKIEVDEKEYLTSLYDLLKTCNVGKTEIAKKETLVMQALNEVTLYKGLNYKIRYYWNETVGSYSFEIYDKEKVGFKK